MAFGGSSITSKIFKQPLCGTSNEDGPMKTQKAIICIVVDVVEHEGLDPHYILIKK